MRFFISPVYLWSRILSEHAQLSILSAHKPHAAVGSMISLPKADSAGDFVVVTAAAPLRHVKWREGK
jgi:hypothetical protein